MKNFYKIRNIDQTNSTMNQIQKWKRIWFKLSLLLLVYYLKILMIFKRKIFYNRNHHYHHHNVNRFLDDKKLIIPSFPSSSSSCLLSSSVSSSSSSSITTRIPKFLSLKMSLIISLLLLLFNINLINNNNKNNYNKSFINLAMAIGGVVGDEFTLDDDVIKNMVRTFGRELSTVGTEQTCLGKIEENFQEYHEEVTWFEGNKMIEDMRNDVMYMLNWKKHSVERIANESERLASIHTYDKTIKLDYYNVKNIDGNYLLPSDMDPSKRILLKQNPNFDDAFVNIDHSAIHVPVNVYDKSPDVINDIKWSEDLTQFFRNNRASDPSLSWQFFGSAKGFLRLYPATSWREAKNFTDKPLIDFYDCRMRPWYIKGAASPKDIVILLDTSGSMTGVRKSIGQSVVEHILDTLTDDDYVAALRFSKEVQPIQSCLDTLVQANKKNLNEIKKSLQDIKTNDPPNFTAALERAFTILQNFNRSGNGSQCNQAIMLITDGAPGTYENVFKLFNWPNIPVRVFTYLIGHDVTAHSEVYWMACHNRGYYAHVMNRAEVDEQVQKYIPVMSRPIVLSGERIFSWTSIYAPTYETELNEHTWRMKQNYELVTKLRALARTQARYGKLTATEKDQHQQQPHDNDNDENDQQGQQTVQEDEISDRKKRQYNNYGEEGNNHNDGLVSIPYTQIPLGPNKKEKKISFYTTLSTPVFDTRNYTNITKRILIKNVYQDSDIETIRIANLLGVAGVDIPIREIEKLTPSFKLGVNGYSFMITNNGYLLNHPDLRPIFEGFLKPFYNAVDMSEVELANNDTLGPRQIDPSIKSIRENMINRSHGWKTVPVKVHIDEMKRVITRINRYTYGVIGQTPFSLAIALPEPYGSYRLTSQVDLRMKHKEGINFTHYFRGNQWRVHPEWAYCDNPHLISGTHPQSSQYSTQQQQQQQTFSTPEESILQFLTNDLEKQNFRWRTSSIRPKVHETILCDKDLIQSLVLDANLTDIPTDKCSSNPNYRDEQRIKTFGIVSTFVATRSGLTRFKDYRTEEELEKMMRMTNDLPFYLKHNKAIEETYYKRSVDFYSINNNKDSFVYFVDFDAGEQHEKRVAITHSRYDSNFLVTATHAIFIGNLKHSTPVAVVGIQFRYDTLHEFFLNITNKFNVPCTHLDVDCYLIDNNGFVVLSNHKTNDVGKFFGQIDGDIMEELNFIGIYKRIHLYDYQAICLDYEIISGPSFNPFINSIFNQIYQSIRSLINWTSILYLNILYGSWTIPKLSFAMDKSFVRQDMDSSSRTFSQYEYSIVSDLSPDNLTRARPCDKEFDLYEMIDFSIDTKSRTIDCGKQQTSNKCSRNFSAQYIPHTNLLLILSINNPQCNCEKKKLSIEPVEVKYNEKEQCELLKTEKYRRRPDGCYNYHAQEKEIRQCGGASSLNIHQTLITSFVIIHITLLNYLLHYLM